MRASVVGVRRIYLDDRCVDDKGDAKEQTSKDL